ncbi:hypothetical protein FA95DRAFT_1612424, partial [Auriscalpium vulgare]
MAEDASTTRKRAGGPDILHPDSPKRVKLATDEPPAASLPSSTLPTSPGDPAAPSKSKGKRDAAGWAKSRKGKEKSTKNVGRRRGTKGDGEG